MEWRGVGYERWGESGKGGESGRELGCMKVAFKIMPTEYIV